MRTILNAYFQAPKNADELGVIPHAIPIYWFGEPTALVATVAINPGPAEFAGLTPRLQVSRTWKESQVCLTGITLSSLPLVEADLRTVMAAAIHDHPAFGA